jgi:uncharacterized GH25 family protein
MERGDMKKLISLIAFALCISAPSFGAEHLLGRSAKVVGKDSYKVTKTSVEDAGKGGAAFLKFVF